jgi:hypothetical protein
VSYVNGQLWLAWAGDLQLCMDGASGYQGSSFRMVLFPALQSEPFEGSWQDQGENNGPSFLGATESCSAYVSEVKVKLSLCLIKHDAMKAYGGVEV